jgi:hypothetical protein
MKKDEKIILKVSQQAIDEIVRKGGHATIYSTRKPKIGG